MKKQERNCGEKFDDSFRQMESSSRTNYTNYKLIISNYNCSLGLCRSP
jgi:hypothetical protein